MTNIKRARLLTPIHLLVLTWVLPGAAAVVVAVTLAVGMLVYTLAVVKHDPEWG